MASLDGDQGTWLHSQMRFLISTALDEKANEGHVEPR